MRFDIIRGLSLSHKKFKEELNKVRSTLTNYEKVELPKLPSPPEFPEARFFYNEFANVNIEVTYHSQEFRFNSARDYVLERYCKERNIPVCEVKLIDFQLNIIDYSYDTRSDSDPTYTIYWTIRVPKSVVEFDTYNSKLDNYLSLKDKYELMKENYAYYELLYELEEYKNQINNANF